MLVGKRRDWWRWVAFAMAIPGFFFFLNWRFFPTCAKYQQSVGLTTQQALSRLGPPTRRIAAEGFKCIEKFLCHPEYVQGEVLFYREGLAGYYLYLDRSGMVVREGHVLID